MGESLEHNSNSEAIRFRDLEERIDKLEKLQAKFEGAGWFVKVFFYIAVPIGGFILWVKDHVKW